MIIHSTSRKASPISTDPLQAVCIYLHRRFAAGTDATLSRNHRRAMQVLHEGQLCARPNVPLSARLWRQRSVQALVARLVQEGRELRVPARVPTGQDAHLLFLLEIWYASPHNVISPLAVQSTPSPIGITMNCNKNQSLLKICRYFDCIKNDKMILHQNQTHEAKTLTMLTSTLSVSSSAFFAF